jgi:hypothetical protein
MSTMRSTTPSPALFEGRINIMWIAIGAALFLIAMIPAFEIFDKWYYCHCPNGESVLDENLVCRKCNGHMYSAY